MVVSYRQEGSYETTRNDLCFGYGVMKEIILVRHGEASYRIEGMTGGWTDKPLTDLGREQAVLTGARIAGMIGDKQCRIYSSDLLRAVETAAAIGAAVGVDPVLTPELRELNNGQAAYLPEEEAKKIELPVTYPLADWVPYPGAESWRIMAERVFAFLEKIAREDTDVATLVSHGDASAAIIHWWLQLGEEAWSKISFDLDPCSITYLTINKLMEKTITKLNDTCHLKPLEHQSR